MNPFLVSINVSFENSYIFQMIYSCNFIFVPPVSFRPVYTGQDTVGSLLTKKPQITTEEFHIAPKKPFFQALCLAAAPLHSSAGGL